MSKSIWQCDDSTLKLLSKCLLQHTQATSMPGWAPWTNNMKLLAVENNTKNQVDAFHQKIDAVVRSHYTDDGNINTYKLRNDVFYPLLVEGTLQIFYNLDKFCTYYNIIVKNASNTTVLYNFYVLRDIKNDSTAVDLTQLPLKANTNYNIDVYACGPHVYKSDVKSFTYNPTTDSHKTSDIPTDFDTYFDYEIPKQLIFSPLFPLPSGRSYKLTCRFQEYRGHYGADFGANLRTPIYAAADGYVRKVGFGDDYGGGIRTTSAGNIVVIDHGQSEDGYYYGTRYQHMFEIEAKLKVGSRVLKGDRIGTVGGTGTGGYINNGNSPSYAPHLHFEILKYAKPITGQSSQRGNVNPENYFDNEKYHYWY